MLAPQMQKQGYQILTLNLRQPKFSNGWNPLAITYKYYYDAVTYEQNNIQVLKDLTLAQLLIKLTNIKCYIHLELACQICQQSLQDNINVYIIEQNSWITDSNYFNNYIKCAILELKAATYE